MDGVADVGGAFFTARYIRTTVVDFTLPLAETLNTFFLANPEVAIQSLSPRVSMNFKRLFEIVTY